MANHASTERTTQLYDRRRDDVTLDEVERILILSFQRPTARPNRLTTPLVQSRSCHILYARYQKSLAGLGIASRTFRSFLVAVSDYFGTGFCPFLRCPVLGFARARPFCLGFERHPEADHYPCSASAETSLVAYHPARPHIQLRLR